LLEVGDLPLIYKIWAFRAIFFRKICKIWAFRAIFRRNLQNVGFLWPYSGEIYKIWAFRAILFRIILQNMYYGTTLKKEK
jgi:hypothetical protein